MFDSNGIYVHELKPCIGFIVFSIRTLFLQMIKSYLLNALASVQMLGIFNHPLHVTNLLHHP